MIEGPFVMMISGLLVKTGQLDFVPTYILLMTGDLTGDMGWYGVGYLWGMPFVRKFGKFFNVTEENVEKVRSIFHRYNATIIFLSKITMGLGFALANLITAGLSKIPFKRFVFWNALGGLLWTAGLMAIGFSLGNFYLKLNGIFGLMSTFASFVIVFIILMNMAKYVRNKVMNKNSL